MFKFSFLLISLLLAIHSSECGVSGRDGRSGLVGRRYNNRYNVPAPPPQPTLPPTPKEYLDAKSSFSTFGIISIIFAIIMCALVFYYSIMCYPFLCASEKKYHFMDVSSTMTTTTSRSIQSIENFPVDQKHPI
ncbi:uncharacterized protein LOC129951536 [Eupeodes corollae]|uniref:uncharacterized protein LOC129951536 n=1 Tax=Eupeodes corollae TaxID=290404 RepID=UPI00248FBA8F|nr:uncharacterized protein LOC129951536 [Eupeodes corollae]